ncbi:Sodium/nucleoside cotransporter [Aphelenchoides bicaudatus]|nr:Sodium/nucleoside cotransporter [Aphelenchoides bicaudatus]
MTHAWQTNCLQIQLSERQKRFAYYAIGAVLILIFHAYVIYATYLNSHRALPVLIALILGYLYVAYTFLLLPLLDRNADKVDWIEQKIDTAVEFKVRGFPVLQRFELLKSFESSTKNSLSCFFLAIVVGFFVWLIIDSADKRIRLRSLIGTAAFLFICFLCSANPSRIKWRPVIGGIVLQFVVGILVLRWSVGNEVIKFISHNAVVFLDYTKVGLDQVYGFINKMPNICGIGPPFIFTSLQIIIYFGSVVSVLYYFGIIQVVLSKVAWVMQKTIGTTAAESLNAAACIFLGQTEAAILIEPTIHFMTESETHAIMTAGYACIAGSLFSAYIAFGACPTYLFSATVMNASVSLALSKLVYPETQKSVQKTASEFRFCREVSFQEINFDQRTHLMFRSEKNVIECISNGAVHSSKFVWAIGANLVVYTALLYLANAILTFGGEMVGIRDLTFNKMLGYAFFPLAYLMAVSDATDHSVVIDETLKVAELMGMKTVLNEFIAYQHLSNLIQTKQLVGKRAIMMVTYALCGFSNISTIGSQIGILSSMCPERKAVAVRGLIAGMFSCFSSACVAGILVSEPISCDISTTTSACFSV